MPNLNSAIWGKGDRSREVIVQIRELRAAGKPIAVNPYDLAPDPAHGIQKELILTFSDGAEYTLPEGQLLSDFLHEVESGVHRSGFPWTYATKYKAPTWNKALSFNELKENNSQRDTEGKRPTHPNQDVDSAHRHKGIDAKTAILTIILGGGVDLIFWVLADVFGSHGHPQLQDLCRYFCIVIIIAGTAFAVQRVTPHPKTIVLLWFAVCFGFGFLIYEVSAPPNTNAHPNQSVRPVPWTEKSVAEPPLSSLSIPENKPEPTPPARHWFTLRARNTQASVIGGAFRAILKLDELGNAPPTKFPVAAGDPEVLMLQVKRGLVSVDAKISDGVRIVRLQRDKDDDRKISLLDLPNTWDMNGDDSAIEIAAFDDIDKKYSPVFQMERIDDLNIKIRGSIAGRQGSCLILSGDGKCFIFSDPGNVRIGTAVAMLPLFEYPTTLRDPKSKLYGKRFPWAKSTLDEWRKHEEAGVLVNMDVTADPQQMNLLNAEGVTIMAETRPNTNKPKP